jgi:hypothetical protein
MKLEKWIVCSMLMASLALATGCNEESPEVGGEGGAQLSALGSYAAATKWCTKDNAAYSIMGVVFQADGAARVFTYDSFMGKKDLYPAGVNWQADEEAVYFVAGGQRVPLVSFAKSGDSDLDYVTRLPSGAIHAKLPLADCTAEQLSKLGL